MHQRKKPEIVKSEKPDWAEKANQTVLMAVRDRDDFFLPEILSAIGRLGKDQVLLAVNSFYPAPLINMMEEKENEFYYEQISPNEHQLYIRGKEKKVDENWLDKKDDFDIIDVRRWKEAPFSELIKLANETPPGE